MYRNTTLAAHAQIDSLKSQLDALSRRTAKAEADRDEARRRLDRAMEGVELDASLDHNPSFRWALWCLRAIGVGGLAVLVAVLAIIFDNSFAPPLISVQGVRNLVYHVEHGNGAMGLLQAAGVAVVSCVWWAGPWVAVLGLRRMKRSAWVLALMTCAAYAPTPLLPLALIAATALLREQVRRAFFPRR